MTDVIFEFAENTYTFMKYFMKGWFVMKDITIAVLTAVAVAAFAIVGERNYNRKAEVVKSDLEKSMDKFIVWSDAVKAVSENTSIDDYYKNKILNIILPDASNEYYKAIAAAVKNTDDGYSAYRMVRTITEKCIK